MRVLTPADVSAGLPAPSAAAALLGKSGAAIMLVLLFLAVTSATSAELIAVSSILTYDVYKVRVVDKAILLLMVHFDLFNHAGCRDTSNLMLPSTTSSEFPNTAYVGPSSLVILASVLWSLSSGLSLCVIHGSCGTRVLLYWGLPWMALCQPFYHLLR